MSSPLNKVAVVILAGGTAEGFEGSFAGRAMPSSRAMVPVAGKTMLQWELDALRNCGLVSSIYVVGDIRAEGVHKVVEPTGDFLGNILAGVAAASADGAESVMIATSDIPLVTPDGIDDFIRRALYSGAEFCYPIVSKDDCLAMCPEMRRTYLRLREGTFSGGNMVLASVDFVLRNREVIGEAYAARKKKFKLAGMIGWGVLTRAMVAQFVYPGAINLHSLESVVSKLLNGHVRAIISEYAEIGEDVDKPDDLAVVERLLSTRGSASRTG